MTKRTREKNNIAVYSRKKQNNDLFREIVSQNKVNEDDLLGKTRAITKIEETQIFNKLDIPVKQETPPEMELPKKKDEIKSTKNEIKKNKGIIAGLLLVLVLLLGGISGYFLMRNKFKDVTIELGTDTVEISEFLVSKNYEKNSSFVTNIDELSLDTVGDYDVTLKYKENSFLTIKSDKGSGIFSTGTSNLTIENISLNTNVIKYDQGTVKVWDNSQISSNVKFYKGDDEVSLDTLYVTPELQEDVVIPDKKSSYELKRRDSFSDIIVFVLIAGVLVAGAIIVLLVTIKNQKRK
jgi:hypothetical protein